MIKKSIKLGIFAGTLLPFAAQLDAAITPSVGEVVVFQEFFDNNDNGWTNVAVVNGVGTDTSGSAAITSGNWQPSVLGDADDVASSSVLSETLDITQGAISLYMSVKVDTFANGEGNRFHLKLGETGGSNRFVSLLIRPGYGGKIEYRDASGSGADTDFASADDEMIAAGVGNYTTLKLTLTADPAGVGSPATAEGFYFDESENDYVSFGIVSNAVDLDSGLFDTLSLYSRNADPSGETGTGGVYFDEIVVTQIPEPSSFALIFGTTALLGFGIRRRTRA
ncbi:MAG: PEP-CTERM sorting domain-containing protein [Verrucomicrobiales bacterium]